MIDLKTSGEAQRHVKYTITVDKVITNCKNCPARMAHHGHGEAWDACRHPNGPGPYENIIHDGEKPFPEWCPA